MLDRDASGAAHVLRMHAQPPHPAEPAYPPHLKARSPQSSRNGSLPSLAGEAITDPPDAAVPRASGQGSAEPLQAARCSPEGISVSGLSLACPVPLGSAQEGSSSNGAGHGIESLAADLQTEERAAGAAGAPSRAAHPTFKGIVFDLETSGLSKSKNRIVEIAALELESGDSMQTLINIHPEQAGAGPLVLCQQNLWHPAGRAAFPVHAASAWSKAGQNHCDCGPLWRQCS